MATREQAMERAIALAEAAFEALDRDCFSASSRVDRAVDDGRVVDCDAAAKVDLVAGETDDLFDKWEVATWTGAATEGTEGACG